MDLPSDEDKLIEYILNSFKEDKDKLQKILDTDYSSGKYPDKSVIEHGIELCNGLLSQQKDNTALLNKLVAIGDDFLDFREDMAEVESFLKNQRNIFDNASRLVVSLSNENDYLQAEPDAVSALSSITNILEMQKPYKKISDLPTLIQNAL